MKIILAVLMCDSCPEQWDFIDLETGGKVAYLRLRHGTVRVDVPDCGYKTIYKEKIGAKAGLFTSEQRKHYLNEAARLVAKHYGWK